MSDRSLNWLKFGGLVSLAFVLGLLFAGLLDLPRTSSAQSDRSVPAHQAQLTQSRNIANLPAVQPLAALSDAFATVAEAVRPSVVYITSRRTERTATRVPPGFEQFFQRSPRQQPQLEQGSGSGFIVSADGYILTNTHVVEGADRVTVELLDRRTFQAKVVGTDRLTDVAVVKIDANGLIPANLGESSKARVGEWVLAVGNPLGDNLTFTVTSGIISAKGRGQLSLPNRDPRGASIQDFIQTDAAINPGNSGGPLLNVRGEVIGINSAIASTTGYYSGYGFAIPIDLASQVMKQLITNGKVQRAVLGVSVTDATPEDADYVGLREIRGVKVERFSETNSPARAAGIQIGDIITAVDGQPVQYTAQLQQTVGFRKPGETVQVEVARKGGERKAFKVRLVAADLSTRAAEDEQPEPIEPDSEGAAIQTLGITVEPVNQTWIEQLDLNPNFRGLVVKEVAPDGPAEGRLNGVDTRSPDIIVGVEGQPVRTEAELRAALRNGSGGVVTLEVYNGAFEDGQGGRRVVRIRLQP
ncbi:MAG TPA: Do family serine endopeptidase [Gemmatimonadales bacterium]|nr:Do family serine endopeptidase [Gemmatimonadales bacterium]